MKDNLNIMIFSLSTKIQRSVQNYGKKKKKKKRIKSGCCLALNYFDSLITCNWVKMCILIIAEKI